MIYDFIQNNCSLYYFIKGDFDQRTIDEERREERVHSPNKDVAWYHNFLHSKTEDERVADVSPNFSDKRSVRLMINLGFVFLLDRIVFHICNSRYMSMYQFYVILILI